MKKLMAMMLALCVLIGSGYALAEESPLLFETEWASVRMMDGFLPVRAGTSTSVFDTPSKWMVWTRLLYTR